MQNKTLLDILEELEKDKHISIGVLKNEANSYWSRSTVLGKTLNLLVFTYPIFTIYFLVKLNFFAFVVTLTALILHVVITQTIACTWVRLRVLNNHNVFQQLYSLKVINIKDNRSSKVFMYPADLTSLLD